MSRAMLILVCLFSLVAYAWAEDKDNPYQLQLDQMVAKYHAIPVTKNVKPLIDLDREIAALVRNAPFELAERVDIRPEHNEIGLDIGAGEHIPIFNRNILLIEAHKRNPYSPYRKDTYYAVVMRDSEPGNDRVDLQPLYAYLKEFPQGSNAAGIYFSLANHYQDLYLVLRGLINKNQNQGEAAFNCYRGLISTKPYPEQMREARMLAIQNYEKLLEMTVDENKGWRDGIKIALDEIKS
jgi:hypothetical protein